MNTQTFFERLVGRKREREQSVVSSYRQLVEAIVNGTEPEPDEVERLLAESGKSLENLQTDCSKLARRKQLRATLDRRPALEKERAKLDVQIAAADRALEEAESKHDEVTRPWRHRCHEIDEALRDASRAESNLLVECENEELKSELQETQREVERLGRERYGAQEKAIRIEKQAASELERADRQLDMSYASQYREHAEALKKDAKELRQLVKQLEKSLNEQQKHCQRLEQKMREV